MGLSVHDLVERGTSGSTSPGLLPKPDGWFIEGFDTADLKQAKALLEELA